MLDFLARFRRPKGSRGRMARGATGGGSKGLSAHWALWGLSALVPLSALALGSIPVAFTVVAAVMAAAVAVAAALGGSSRRGAPMLPFFVLSGLAIYTLLQSVPMPLGLLGKLDPAAADVWARSLAPIRGQVTWGSISLDPGNTSVEAAKWASYACVFYAASSLTRSHGVRACLQIVVFSTVLVALVTLGHQLLEAKKVFGVYQPRGNFPGRIGPLLNSNHLAGFLNLGALCAVGLALSPQGDAPRWLFATAAIIDVGASLRAASRGGAASLLVGLLLLGVLIAIPSTRSQQKEDRSRRIAGLTMVAATGAVGVALAAFGFDRALWLELASTDTGKMRMAAWFKPMIADYWSFGIGRGAFESAFEAYRPSVSGNTVFTHPENFVAQWISEWGLVGVVALVAFVWLFRPWKLGLLRSVKSAGALAAVVAIAIHNLADFSLEVPGVAIAFFVVLGSLWGNVRGRGAVAAPAKAPFVPVAATASIAVIASVLSLSRGLPSLATARDDVHALVSAANQGKLPAATAKDAIVANMRRFPAEYYFSLAGADLTFHAGQDPIPWIQRALERGPSIGLTHFILSEYLATRGARSQAFMELGLAAEYEAFLAVPIATTALSWSRDFNELSRVAPGGVAGIAILELMASRVKDPELSNRLDEEILVRDPGQRAARARILERLFAKLGSGDCDDRIECEEAIATSSAALSKYLPQSSIGDQYLARFVILDGDPRRARQILREGCLKLEDVSGCLQLQATVEDEEQLPHVLERYVAANCRTNADCAEAYAWMSGLYAGRKSWALAYGAAEKGARKAPNEARWTRAADLAEQAGLHQEAVRALQELGHYRGLDPEINRRIEANRASVH